MHGAPIPEPQRLVLDNVSWRTYARLLRILEGRHLRLTYDRGRLEIMTPTFERGNIAAFLGRTVVTLTEELNLPISSGGSTTLRERKEKKGLEPDNCYWIAHEADVRGNKVIVLRDDPPPDLVIEVDITRSSMNRMRIYASLNVPEVWRWHKDGLDIHTLNAGAKYDRAPVSPTFPVPISPADLMPFIAMRSQMDDNAVIRQLRAWTRAKLAGNQS